MSLNTGWEEIITLQYLHIWKQCTRVANFLVGARLSPFYGLPGGPVDKNSPANAGDVDSTPGLERSRVPEGKQARVPRPLKPMILKPVLCNQRSHGNEKPVHHNWRKSVCHNKDPLQPNINLKIIIKLKSKTISKTKRTSMCLSFLSCKMGVVLCLSHSIPVGLNMHMKLGMMPDKC